MFEVASIQRLSVLVLLCIPAAWSHAADCTKQVKSFERTLEGLKEPPYINLPERATPHAKRGRVLTEGGNVLEVTLGETLINGRRVAPGSLARYSGPLYVVLFPDLSLKELRSALEFAGLTNAADLRVLVSLEKQPRSRSKLVDEQVELLHGGIGKCDLLRETLTSISSLKPERRLETLKRELGKDALACKCIGLSLAKLSRALVLQHDPKEWPYRWLPLAPLLQKEGPGLNTAHAIVDALQRANP